MNAKITKVVTRAIDDAIVIVRDASAADEIPMLQADEIIDALLEARHAMTAGAARDPESAVRQ